MVERRSGGRTDWWRDGQADGLIGGETGQADGLIGGETVRPDGLIGGETVRRTD